MKDFLRFERGLYFQNKGTSKALVIPRFSNCQIVMHLWNHIKFDEEFQKYIAMFSS